MRRTLILICLTLSTMVVQAADQQIFSGKLSVLPNYCITLDAYKKIAPEQAKQLAITYKGLDSTAPLVCVLFKNGDYDHEYGNLYVAERIPALYPVAEFVVGGNKTSLLGCNKRGAFIRMYLPLWRKKIEATLEAGEYGHSFQFILMDALLMIKDTLPPHIQKHIEEELKKIDEDRTKKSEAQPLPLPKAEPMKESREYKES